MSVAAAAYLIALKTLPDMQRATHRFDVPNALLLGAGMGSIIFGVGSAAHRYRLWFRSGAECSCADDERTLGAFVGQTLGAALAALCFLLAGEGGATLALWLAAGFSMLGCVLSLLRLAAPPAKR